MDKKVVYKQGIENMQMSSIMNQIVLIDESQDIEIKKVYQLFMEFAILFQEQEINKYIEMISKLNDLIFQDEPVFNSVIFQSPETLLIFFQQCSELLLNISNESKEIIIFQFSKLIKNKSFSSTLTNFKGDIMLADLYQKVSEKADDCILNTLILMKLSPEFPIKNFKEYFINNTNDVRFIALFINSMDQTDNIDKLFLEFVSFPPPQKQDSSTFRMFCKVIILFFQHSLDESVFIESKYYDKICSFSQSDFSDESIGYLLQIAARLSNHVELLNHFQPNFLFTLFVYKTTKSIVVPVITIIDALMKSETHMSSLEFIQKYVNQHVISAIMRNLKNETFLIRVKTLCLLNSFIVKSDYTLFWLLIQYNERHGDNTIDFCEVISEIIIDLLSSDDAIITLALELAYHIFTYAHRQPDQAMLRRVLNVWETCGIIERIQCLTSDEGKISEDAQIVYQKIVAFYKKQ